MAGLGDSVARASSNTACGPFHRTPKHPLSRATQNIKGLSLASIERRGCCLTYTPTYKLLFEREDSVHSGDGIVSDSRELTTQVAVYTDSIVR